MKKTSLLLAVAALLSSSALSVLSVNAAETPAGKTSVAEFNVTGESGELTLNEVPDMLFKKNGEDISIKDIYSDNGSNKLTYSSKEAVKGNKKESLDVTDYRGTGAGWNVVAKMTNFVNENDKNSTLTGVLTYNDGNKDNKNDGDKTITSGGTATIVKSDVTHYTGTPTTDTTLTVTPESKKTTAGQYDADITWTLSDTAADATK